MLARHAINLETIHLEKEALRAENKRLRDELENKYRINNIIGNSNKMREVYQMISQVSRSNATVLIRGESGTGKELVAKAIHYGSLRSDGPFVDVNCAAIPDGLQESELFGHEKGAFTGATQSHAGKFEQADNGTLLLDEISEMDLALQAKLLRVLQEKEVERIGGRKTIPLNVRVIATTNRDLKQYVADKRFREDLYYRLNVFPLHIAPLTERRGDILPLADTAMRRHADASQGAVALSHCAEQVLLAHDWPGNVRELENLVQRSLILLQGQSLGAADLAFEVDPAAPAAAPETGLTEDLKNHEFHLIVDAMRQYDGKRAAVAEALGISPRTLRYKLARMREQGIEVK